MSGQKKAHSLWEQIANQIVSFAIAWPINMALLPALGVPASAGKAFIVTVIFTIVSFIRGYFMRRLFNLIQIKG